MSTTRVFTLLFAAGFISCGTTTASSTQGFVIAGQLNLVGVGATTQLAATNQPDAKHLAVDVTSDAIWTSSDAAVAMVSSSGLVTAVGLGSATISGRYQLERRSVNIQVLAVTGLAIVGTATLTSVGQTALLSTSAVTSAGKVPVTAGVEWSSSDPSIATVSTSGVVKAAGGIGTVDITASYQGFAAKLTLTILLSASHLTLTGDTALTDIGQTSQLTLLATVSDGNMRDVTSLSTWQSEDTSIVTVSPQGLLRAVALGVSEITATYGPTKLVTFHEVTVTPAGTFIANGRVRFPGHAGVPNVAVRDTVSGRSTTTDADGNFDLAALAGTAQLTFDAAGYEPAAVTVSGSPGDVVVDASVAIQPLIRIVAGETAQATLAPNDTAYDVTPAVHCTNCRLIRIVAPDAGTLHVNLTWDRPLVGLTIWIGGQPFTGPAAGSLTVDTAIAAGENVVYVGVTSGAIKAGDLLTLTVATSLEMPEAAR